MLSGPGKRPPPPRSGASGLSSGSLLFLPKRRVIIAQPLPADRALQPGRGAWGGNVDWPEISPASRQAAAPDRSRGRPGRRGPVHPSNPAPTSPGHRRGTASRAKSVLDDRCWGRRGAGRTTPRRAGREPAQKRHSPWGQCPEFSLPLWAGVKRHQATSPTAMASSSRAVQRAAEAAAP
ncbi:nutritionally-regulated adipose and cardiac enriched protein homolog isoform X1 [Bos indicus x Bos taurus]|uniref:nutritionally-regulated adipose and cardiac enriched protein homolog isoform X1 n=1 Tax=Bos indicus x Bos taurus TaxID=30522 RepID=UPI000F7D3E78|nr:nutritionally-regulated adipose and cardiac enriched protein homolog isoform X1 [Bos indicus x Bos taurus]